MIKTRVIRKALINGITVAVKVPKKQIWDSPNELTTFQKEIMMLKYMIRCSRIIHCFRKIYHPNVVLYLGACTDPGNVRIVLERMICDLDKMLHKPHKIPEELHKFLKSGLTFPMKLKMAHDAVPLCIV